MATVSHKATMRSKKKVQINKRQSWKCAILVLNVRICDTSLMHHSNTHSLNPCAFVSQRRMFPHSSGAVPDRHQLSVWFHSPNRFHPCECVHLKQRPNAEISTHTKRNDKQRQVGATWETLENAPNAPAKRRNLLCCHLSARWIEKSDIYFICKQTSSTVHYSISQE